VRPAAPEQAGDQAHKRQWNEPGDLAEELVVEETQRTDLAAETETAAAAARAASGTATPKMRPRPS